MEACLVNVLQWQRPIKSIVAMILLNAVYWLLLGQRPLFVLSLCFLLVVLRSCWKRVRGEILVDPPDHESWTPLETYSMRHDFGEFLSTLFSQYFLLRTRSHIAFTIVSCCIFLGIYKIGTYIYLRTLLFLVANGAFCVGPLIKIKPKQVTEDELVPDAHSDSVLWSPSDVHLPQDSEGLDSLQPFVVQQQMRGHDEESDDEFHFDTKHFDSSRSSTSSTSTSFELVNL